MEQLVVTPQWQAYVQMVNAQRDRWLNETSFPTNRDNREYLSAQAHTVNLLTQAPFDAIDIKQRILQQLAEAEERRLEAIRLAAEEPQPEETHPAPQLA